MQIQTADIQAYAMERMTELRRRADSYLTQARAQAGSDRCLILCGMIDALADECCGVATACCGLLGRHGDWPAADAVHVAYNDSSRELIAAANEARMLSLGDHARAHLATLQSTAGVVQ